MEESNQHDLPELAQAIQIWAGRGLNPWPVRSDQRVINHFGKSRAEILLSQIKALEEDFYSTDANLVGVLLQDMMAKALADFLKKHPAMHADIVQVLVWCYSYDYK